MTLLAVSDLTLAALSHHPTVRSAAARTEAAQMGIEAAQWQFWPTPSFGVERVEGGTNALVSEQKTQTVLSIQQPLWTGGRLQAGLKRAEFKLLQSEAEAKEVRQALAVRVIQAWSEAVVALRKIEAQNQSMQAHQRLLQMVERRLAEGASAQADVALARGRINSLEADIQLINTQLESALDKLRLLTGMQLVRESLTRAHEPQSNLASNLNQLLEQAKTESPQLQKNKHLVQVARAEVDVAKASLMPELSARYVYQQGGLNQAAPSSANRLFLSLSSNLGAGLSALSGVESALAQLKAAEEEIEVQEQNLFEQVQQDFTLIKAAQVRVKGLSLASAATTEVLESYERQFLAGRKQWLDLMNAAREQAQSDSQLADAMGALELSTLRLVLLTGGVDALVQVKSQSAGLKAAR